jgi:rubredoxin
MKYKCRQCGWIGEAKDMELQCRQLENDDADEVCSMWICPACKAWHQLKDYEVVEAKTG